MKSDEVEAIVTIWNRSLVRDPIDTGRFVSWLLADPDYWPGDDSGFFVARVDQKPVGFLRAIIRRQHNERLGLEETKAWMPVFAVDPDHRRSGIGAMLVQRGLDWIASHGKREIWISGGSGSAPGYIFPGVDVEAYADGLRLLQRYQFQIDHHAVSMSREITTFGIDRYEADAWEVGQDVKISTLTPADVQDLLEFFAAEFPGDWVAAARPKFRGRMHELLVARREGKIVGYCQWEGEHFGPFGVASRERNGRVGAKLFVEAVKRIRGADGRNVWFNWADPDAQRFYKRFGMQRMRSFAILHRPA
jgi:GNAT superfamily N-acetyltransferase